MSYARRTRDTTTGADPSAPVDQTHAPVGVDGAINPPGAPPISMCREEDARVKVLHGPSNKLRAEGVPDESELFERSSFFGNLWGGFGLSGAFQQIRGVDGSPRLPGEVSNQSVPGTIFIDGAPSMADVQQGDLADCYFLASIAGIVQGDPAAIQAAVTPAGDAGASVRLYRHDGANAVPVTLSVTEDLRVEDFGGGATGATPLGAGMRAGQRPEYTEYWCEIQDQTLTIYADRYYETARWAPLLEKGYAQFAGQHGQYGGFRPEEKGAPGSVDAPASDYDYLNGGIAQHSYQLIYGPNALSVGELVWNYTPGANNVTANLGVIQNLLWAQGVGVPDGQEMHMTVGASRDGMVERLDEMATALLAGPDIGAHPELQVDVTVLQAMIAAWRSAAEADLDTALADVASAAEDVVDRAEHPELYADTSPRSLRDFGENANIVAQIATDSSPGQRHTYAWHSYTVLGSTFKAADGSDLALTQANVATEAANIDAAQSTVRLRNPHGHNSPNLDGATGIDTGEFTLTLDSFLRSFEFEQFGVVRT